MLDLVKSIQLPTVGELEHLIEFSQRKALLQTYVRRSEGNKVVDCTFRKTSDGHVGLAPIECNRYELKASFFPVFELKPAFHGMYNKGDKVTIAVARINYSEAAKDNYIAFSEPSSIYGLSAYCLSNSHLIAADPIFERGTIMSAYTCIGDLPEFRYAFCPYCGSLHRLGRSTFTGKCKHLICADCGSGFVASAASPVGISYLYRPANTSQGVVESSPVQVPMNNGAVATTLVCGWPAGVAQIDSQKFFELCTGRAQTVHSIVTSMFGMGWDTINFDPLVRRILNKWSDATEEEVRDFLAKAELYKEGRYHA